MDDKEDAVIPVVEETVKVGVRQKTLGRVRVSTRTEVFTEEVAAAVTSQDVTVTRVPVGRDIAPGEPVPQTREENGTTILPILEEVLVVETRLRLVEEVHIAKTSTVQTLSVPVTLRRQVADIQREDGPNPPNQEVNQMDYDSKRTVSAFYETRAAAEAHKAQLETLGVMSSDITIVEGADQNEPQRRYEEKGFFEAIADFFMGEEDRGIYNEGLRRGGYLLTARVDGAHYDRALEVLDTDEAVDLDERSSMWRSEGWEGSARGLTGDETIEVMQEDVRIGKRDVSHGRVRVRSYVVEEPVSQDVNLRSERVEVERRPVDRPAEPGAGAFQERTIEAEETTEEPVVSKEARVVEEVGLRKRTESDTQTITETARRTEVDIEDDRDK